MNAKTTAMLAEYHYRLANLGPRVLIAVIDLFAIEFVENHIEKNPLPVDDDPDEIRSVMLMICVTKMVERAMRLIIEAEAAQQPADRQPSPQDDAIAMDAANAAIAKAQGKLN